MQTNETVLAYLTTLRGVVSVTFASSRGKAKAQTMRAAREANCFGLHFKEVTAKRAPPFDDLFLERFKGKCLNPDDVMYQISLEG